MKKTVLIVDDKKLLRDSLVDYLEEEFHTLEAESGEKAIEIVREKPVDVIILDINLPGIDGIKTLQLLKKIKRETPVIGLTGELTIDIREKFLRAGAFDLQTKSAIYERLLPTMQDALAGKPHPAIDIDEIDYLKIAQDLFEDKRWEESALYLKEAGIEKKMLGQLNDAKTLLKQAIERYNRAGRTSKAKLVEVLLEEIEG
jgi:CheY-like chemotaxis protein